MRRFLQIFAVSIPIVLLAFIAGDTDYVYIIPQKASSVCSNDLELDDDNDLIVGHLTPWEGVNPTLTILKNDGFGFFSISDSSKSFAGYQEYILSANIDNDSFPDIVTQNMNVVSGNTERFIRVFYNNGEGSFNNYTDFPLNGGNDVLNGITVGDINGDQKNDVLLIVNLYKYWGVLYNDGNGDLLPPVYFNVNNYPTDVASEDLNDDGRDDVILASVPCYIYYSYSTGFQLDSLSGDINIVKINDMNNDGRPDIIGKKFIYGTGVVIYENLGDESFVLHTIGGFSFSTVQMVISDMNNDSLQDIILVPQSWDGIYILHNLGNFIFNSPVFISIPEIGYENGRRICTADFDGNGFNDIALIKVTGGTGTQYPNLILLFNDGNGNFVPDPITFLREKKLFDVPMKNYPNPFHGETTFMFSTGNFLQVELIIYNVYGEIVYHEMHNNMTDNQGKIMWNGKDSDGNHCPPGIYITCLKYNKKLLSSIKIIIN